MLRLKCKQQQDSDIHVKHITVVTWPTHYFKRRLYGLSKDFKYHSVEYCSVILQYTVIYYSTVNIISFQESIPVGKGRNVEVQMSVRKRYVVINMLHMTVLVCLVLGD
jgi:hypothetical protein